VGALLQAALLAAGLAAPPPARPQEVPVFSAELSLVNVSVSVEDRQGRPIPGLGASDFVLTEDGKRRPIELCARIGEPGGGPSTTLSVALLVDTSDSMLGTLRRSRAAAVRFLSGLPGAEPLVVLFDQDQHVERFDPGRPEALFERLDAVPDGGNTALRDAITVTLGSLASPAGRSALVLLTDGVDTVSTTSPQALERAVQSNAVVIYAVAFRAPGGDDGAGRKTLERLAQLSGGRSFRLPDEHALPGVLDEILADLRAQYVLGFAPDPQGPRDRYRRIRVKVPGHAQGSVRHREGYRLPR
jgi:Ca-activated chloride channel family protein